MLQKKICLLGGFSVGKTSLVRRYVHSLFSDAYLTTVGVKIDKKLVTLSSTVVTLMIWDIYGEDDFQRLNMSYLRGAAGYLLVADGTRAETVEKCLALRHRAAEVYGEVPCLLALNKSDLLPQWQITPASETELTEQDLTVLHTSAKTGLNVEEAFFQLTTRMLQPTVG